MLLLVSLETILGEFTVEISSNEVIPSAKIPYTIVANFSDDVMNFDISKVKKTNIQNIIPISYSSNTYIIHIYPVDDLKSVTFQLDVGAGISKSGEESSKSNEMTITFSKFIEDIYFYSSSSAFEYWYNGLSLPEDDDTTRYLLFQIEESNKIADKDVEFEIAFSPSRYVSDTMYCIHQSNNLTTVYKLEDDVNILNITADKAFNLKYKYANNLMVYDSYYSGRVQITFENVNTSESITLTDTEPDKFKYISFRSLSNNILHVQKIDFTRKNQTFTIQLNYNPNDFIYSPLEVYYVFNRPVINALYSIYFETCDSVYVEKEREIDNYRGIISITPLYKTTEKCIISMVGTVYSIDGDVIYESDLDSITYPEQFIDNYKMNYPNTQYRMKYKEWTNIDNKNNKLFEIMFDLQCIDDIVLGFSKDNVLYPYEITFGAVNNHYINITYTYSINYTINEIVSSINYQICEKESKFTPVWCRIEILDNSFKASYGLGKIINENVLVDIEVKNKTELVVPHYFTFKSVYNRSYVRNIQILDNNPDISSNVSVNSFIVLLLLLILF